MVLAYGTGACDSLPFLDLDIDEDAWRRVEESIRREMDHVETSVVTQDGDVEGTMHPMVDVLLPLVASNHRKPVLLEEIERYERELVEDLHDDDMSDEEEVETYTNHHNVIVRDGIRYPATFYNENDEINFQAIYTALSHSQLEARNLGLLKTSEAETAKCQQDYVNQLTEIHQQLETQKRRKRRDIDDIEHSRKKRQLEGYGPVEGYLRQRWHDLIRSIVDMGAEMAHTEFNEE